MSLSVPSPSEDLQEKAKKFANFDLLATFSRGLDCDSTSNITIPQAMASFKELSNRFAAVRGMEDVGAAIQQAAMPMVAPVAKLGGSAAEQEELTSFFCVSPEDVQSMCSTGALDLPEQTKSLFREKEEVGNYLTLYYTLLLVIRRHGQGLGLIDYYWACCTSSETSIWQWTRDATAKAQRLKSLKVRTQAYLANTLVQRNPDKLYIDYSNDPETESLLG